MSCTNFLTQSTIKTLDFGMNRMKYRNMHRGRLLHAWDRDKDKTQLMPTKVRFKTTVSTANGRLELFDMKCNEGNDFGAFAGSTA